MVAIRSQHRQRHRYALLQRLFATGKLRVSLERSVTGLMDAGTLVAMLIQTGRSCEDAGRS